MSTFRTLRTELHCMACGARSRAEITSAGAPPPCRQCDKDTYIVVHTKHTTDPIRALDGRHFSFERPWRPKDNAS